MVGFPASHVKPEGKSHPTRTTRTSAAVPWNRGGCFAKTPLDGQKTCCSTWVLSRISIGPGGAAGYIFSNPQKETQAKWFQINDTLYYLCFYILVFLFFLCVVAIIYINCITHMYTYYGMQHLLSCMHCLGISQTKWTFTYMENHPTKYKVFQGG